MTTRLRSVSNRRALIAAGCIAALAVLLAAIDGSAETGIAGIADTAAVGPDVTVFDFTDIRSWGSAGGFAAYSIGANACNRGDAPLNWCDQASGCAPGAATNDHPVIAQNLYRLKNGRFDQIGMSWLKHGFASLNGPDARCAGAAGQACQPPPAGENQLGVGCVDPYVAFQNGSPPLGRRSEVNATTGTYPFPYSTVTATQVYDQRIKVLTMALDPALNIGATYWAEVHYISPHDALAGNGLNNASYRQVTVGASPNYPLTMTGTFFERQPAINAWKMQDPIVTLINVDVPGTVAERFHVGRKVTDLGGGLWHYEYAVHNLNSDRGARAFEVEFPGAVSFTNVGFKDIDSHSGEPYSTLDWTVFSSGGLLSWATDTFATDPNANALRWGTMYNFWFDADQPPTGSILHTVELFKTGDPGTVSFTIDGLFADGFESGGITRWTGGGS
jgi:hypothetical protein